MVLSPITTSTHTCDTRAKDNASTMRWATKPLSVRQAPGYPVLAWPYPARLRLFSTVLLCTTDSLPIHPVPQGCTSAQQHNV